MQEEPADEGTNAVGARRQEHMASVDQLQTRMRDARRQQTAIGRRTERVVASGQHQGRLAQAVQPQAALSAHDRVQLAEVADGAGGSTSARTITRYLAAWQLRHPGGRSPGPVGRTARAWRSRVLVSGRVGRRAGGAAVQTKELIEHAPVDAERVGPLIEPAAADVGQ